MPCIALRLKEEFLGGGGGGGVVGWCKPIFMSNPQPSCFGLLLGWVAVAWLGFGVMTIRMSLFVHSDVISQLAGTSSAIPI